jgi:predicted nuclease of restriction endonuclease-like (RecB) superfamily
MNPLTTEDFCIIFASRIIKYFDMNFESLVGRINLIQDALQAQAAHAVNLSLTARNWLVGYYIVEYEQHGEDRAKYGEKLINRLAEKLNRRGFNPRRLRDYRHVYQVYPFLGETICGYLQSNPIVTSNSEDSSIWLFSTAKLQTFESQLDEIQQSAIATFSTDETQSDEKWRMPSAKLEEWSTPADKLFYRLNYTLLSYLATIEDPLKRAFYEQETIRGCWTQKELDRQVSSLYYERLGLSKNKKALQRYVAQNAQQLTPQDIIHDPVTLEFLDVESQDIYKESKLEAAILNNLQRFLLEMGHGFCFEHRQKRILIDQDYHKADLIFYHRILKCHVIIDLKIDRFRHEYASQLNFYMNYYKHEMMQDDDNPPIGILLCTDYNETTVQYAIEGLSQNLFVSKYGMQLPSEDDLRKNMLKNITEEDFKKMKEA